MSEMRSLNGPSVPQSQFSGKRSFSSAMEIDSWMPSHPEAISPLLNRLMLLIEGSQCVPGEEFAVELALREALRNAVVVHDNQERPKARVHIRCRCWPGKAISIVVTAQGKEFDFGNSRGDGLLADPLCENRHGIQLIEAYMDDVYFERGGSEIHMCKRSRTNASS
jgi:anti-sigma regulatory factor (Ser/Thr protein kinase)